MSEIQNLTELPAVARNINLPCKKCGVDRFHVVVAHTTANSAKVKCEVCGANKTFKLPKVQERRSNVKRPAKKVKAPDAGAVWNELKTQIGTDALLPYDMKKTYKLANAINHSKFGIGFVTGVSGDRIEVAFQEATRALVHGRP
jgi:hypothetical protein